MPESVPKKRTQTIDAEVLGVDPTTLARWERGERKPIGEARYRILSALSTLKTLAIAPTIAVAVIRKPLALE